MANSKKINEITQIESLVGTDLLIADTENGTRAIPYEKLIKPVNDSIALTNQNVAAITPANNAAAHNGIFRGKDLTSLGVAEICTRISNGTFEDLYIGDYFDITIAGEGGNEVVRCILAGFNTYLHNGDTDFTTNHAVIVTKNCLNTLHQMNPTNTTEGGFVGSDMWKTIIPLYNTAFGNVLGSHLLSHRTLLTNTIGSTLASNAGAGFTGASSNWAWTDTKLSLLSEIQVYGSNVFSSSFYDTGCNNLQLPLFALDPTAKVCGKGGTGVGRQWYWLRNVASAANFALVSDNGFSDYAGASGSYGVRPLFCIG